MPPAELEKIMQSDYPALVVQCFVKLDTLKGLCLSLLQCDGIEQIDLIFWLDSHIGNTRRRYAPLQKRVMSFLKKFQNEHGERFASCEIRENSTNLGTCKTCEVALNYAFSNHDFCIFTEDDTIFARDTFMWFASCKSSPDFESERVWAITGESVFFNAQHKQVDVEFVDAARKYASDFDLIHDYIEVEFITSTCFATIASKWKQFSITRGQPLGDEDVNSRCASENKRCLMPVVPRIKDVGMLHELGFSVTIHSAAGVRELKNTYLTSDSLLNRNDVEKISPRLYLGNSGQLYGRFTMLEDYVYNAEVGANKMHAPPEIDIWHDTDNAEVTSDDQTTEGRSSGGPVGPLIPKTFSHIDDITPGTFVPEDDLCYDPGEIDELGYTLQRLMYAPFQIRKRIEAHGASIVANAHSGIPTILDLERSFQEPDVGRYNLIFRDDLFLRNTLEQLIPYAEEFAPPVNGPALSGDTEASGFQWENSRFSYSDAMSYYAMLRYLKPKTVIEVGGGWSTLIASEALRRNDSGRIISIAPNEPELLHYLADPHRVMDIDVRELSLDFFNNNLDSGDVLHFDSSHTVQHGGDTLFLYLEILPRLASSVNVHVHDIKLPFAFSIETMRDNRIYWNEQYLLYAYLLGNPSTKTLYGSSFHAAANPDLLKKLMHNRYGAGGVSFWFSQDQAL